MQTTSRPVPTGTHSWRAAARPLIETIIRERAVPGLVVAVARGGGALEYLVIGTDATGASLTENTLFPVASITKLATALAALRLVATGALALDAPLARYLPDAAAARDGITPRTLLCHVAGLPLDLAPEAAPYTPSLDWPVLARACLLTPPTRPPRTLVSYSNLGPGLLAIVTERLTGRPFTAALTDLVLAPLGIEGYLGTEPPRTPARISGDLGEHAGTDLEPYNSAFWRSLGLPWGGLVTTAAGALALVHAFAGTQTGFLPPDLLAEATRDQTGGFGGEMVGLFEWPRCPWGLGAELRGDKSPHWTPPTASPTSYGHAGASGCLVWADPFAEVSWAVLGPRTLEGWADTLPALGAAILASAGAPASQENTTTSLTEVDV